MIDFNVVYRFLNKIGYSHPIHPTEVHMPIGLVVGALVFAVIAAVFKRERLRFTPAQCLILAFIWIFPTMLFGFMDWQHFYSGAWLFPIKVKLIVAPSLAILLLIALYMGHKYGTAAKRTIAVYFFCFCLVVVLGYFGGQLVYGNIPSTPVQARYKSGEKIFTANCSACHPHGGNLLKPNLPLIGSGKLTNFDTFLAFIRNPRTPDGSKGPMPVFTPSKMPEKKAKDLYEYITQVLAQPKEK